ncbi:MAG: hypothetical protein KA035_02840 [Candidatus Levybacteria bacterium]|nr:hypothetical protein [Candidatus Levybacteria bacterium]
MENKSTQNPTLNPETDISQLPNSTPNNTQKKKFKFILIGFFVLFFLTLGTAAAIYSFKEVSRSNNNEFEQIPSISPKPTNEFEISPLPQANGECVISGCSRQFCVSKSESEGFVSTCEYKEEYACYKTATCEVQANGTCGWTQTAELTACLKNPASIQNTNTSLNKIYNNPKGFSFQYPDSLVKENSSTNELIGFLQKQGDLMAKRLVVMVFTNYSDTTPLSDVLKSENLSAESNLVLSQKNINNTPVEILSYNQSLSELCGAGGNTQVKSPRYALAKTKNVQVLFITNNSCDTFKSDWFSPILTTLKFTN